MTKPPILLLVIGIWFCNRAVLAESQVWRRHVIDDASHGADGVRLADFNADGKLDVVTGWEQGGVVRVCLHPGEGSVHERWPAVTVGPAKSVEDAVAVDLDADGRLDVVSCCEGTMRTIFLHWGPANAEHLLVADAWKTQPLPASIGLQQWMFCLPMQIDGRHGVDLLVGSKGPRAAVGWWQSPAEPRKLDGWRYHRLIDAGWIMSLVAHDVDHDGDLDVILSDRKGNTRGVKWLERMDSVSDDSGDVAWREHLIGAADKELMFLTVSDVDQDGADDILATTWNHTLELFRRVPASRPRWKQTSIPNAFGLQRAKSVCVADFDRDHRLDVVTTNRSQPLDGPAIALLRFPGRRLDSAWTATDIGGPEGSKFDLVEPVDVDSDGDLDLITCEEVSNLGVFWYENPTFP